MPFSDVDEFCAGAAVMSHPSAHSLQASVVAPSVMCVSPASHMSSFTVAKYCFALLDMEVTLP